MAPPLNIRKKLLALGGIPLLVLLLLASHNLIKDYREQADLEQSYELGNFLRSLSHFNHQIQIERGLSCGTLKTTQMQLEWQTGRTDRSIAALRQELKRIGLEQYVPQLADVMSQINRKLDELPEIRRQVSKQSSGCVEVLDWYTRMVMRGFEMVDRLDRLIQNPVLVKQLALYTSFIHHKDQVGQVRGFVNGLLQDGVLAMEEKHRLIAYLAKARFSRQEFTDRAPPELKQRFQRYMDSPTHRDAHALVQVLEQTRAGEAPTVSIEQWFEVFSHKIDGLLEIEQELIDRIFEAQKQYRQQLAVRLYLEVALLLIALLITGWAAHYFMRAIERSTIHQQEMLSRLQTTHDATSEGILIVDRNGEIAEFNRRFAEIWRLPFETLRGMSDEEALTLALKQLKDPSQFIGRVEMLYATPEMSSDDLLEFADGRMISRHTRPQYRNGEVVGRIWNFRDVTELFDLQQRYEVVKNASREGVHILDSRGNVVDCSPSFAEMLGYPWLEAMQLNVKEWDAQIPAERLDQELSRLIAEGDVFETLHRRKDGSTFAVEVSAWGIELEGEQHLYAVSRDITERKQVEEAKANFLATMSHELRTPLTAIIGNNELIAETELDPDQRQLLSSSTVAGRHLLSLVNDILDLSKIEAGKFEVSFAPFDLSQLLDEVQSIFVVKASEAALDFEVHPLVEPEVQLWGDARHIEQVLINLLGNAIKFTEQGGVSLTCSQEGEWLIFVVEDSGIGISQAQLESLFKPFQQADGSIGRRYGGTGLGLYLSNVLAQEMEGEIVAQSEEGKGSRFTLQIPYRESELPLQVVEAVEEAMEASDIELSGEVLIAEDALELQLLERRMIEALGVGVTVAGNGREAVDLATERHFDLILMDMNMPEMGGIEATAMLRERGVETPVVALTANVMHHHRAQFQQAGAREFLNKPIDRQALQQVVRKYLQSGTPEEMQTLDVLSEVTDSAEQGISLLIVDDEQSVLELYQHALGKEQRLGHEVVKGMEMMLGITTMQDLEESSERYDLTLAMQGEQAIQLARKAIEEGNPFPVAFIDMRMPPGMDGLETAKALRQLDDRIYLVIVTAYSDRSIDEINRQLEYGVLYLEKPFSETEVQQMARMLVKNRERDERLEHIPGDVEAGPQLLVVEDSPEMQQLTRRIVERMGYRVAVADNGQEAVILAAQIDFALILMDVQMPVMDGIKATRTIRESGNAVPIVALSANVTQEHREQFLEIGGDEYLTKPVSKELLKQTLVRLIEQKMASPVSDDVSEVSSTAISSPHLAGMVDEEMMVVFRQSAAGYRDAIDAALAGEDWEELRGVAHTVKGSAASFGFNAVSQQAFVLQQVLDEGELDSVVELTQELLDELDKVL